MQFEKWYDIDLKKPRQFVPDLGFPVFVGDENSVRIGVNLLSDKSPVDVAGTVKGYATMPNGMMAPPFDGAKDGNHVWVEIPALALEMQGRIQVAIRLIDGDEKTVIFAAYATVRRVDADTVIDPDDIVPTWDDILTKIAQMDAAADACNDAAEAAEDAAEGALANFAPAFAEATANAAGSYVTYTDGKMYLLPNGHTVNTTWANTTKSEVKVGGELTDLKGAVTGITTATVADEGKALLAKTVSDGKVTEWVFGEAGGGMTATQANLLLTILGEGVYGSDQEANIELLRKALMDIAPVRISAVLESTPLVGLYYSDLEFTVTATFDDESTMVIDGYRIVTPGAVVSGSNTVTVAFRGVTTDVTFTASSEQTYTISYSLTDVTASNKDYLIIAGERYETTLSVEDDDHYISSVVVMMGGVEITSTAYINGTIIIAEVTGNVTITAVGAEYTYMDELIRTRERTSATQAYSGSSYTDDSTVIFTLYYEGTIRVSEYPALNTCSLHWTITNNTDSAVSLNNVGFGAVPCNDPDYPPASMNSTLKIPYAIKCTTQSGNLDAGKSIEGDYTLPAGYQLAFIGQSANGTGSIEKLTVRIRGNYVADTFSGYNIQFAPDYTAPYYGKYRDVVLYSDNGETQLAIKKGDVRKLTDTLSAGTYDFMYRFCCDWDKGVTADKFAIGALENAQSTASNYASVTPPYDLTAQIWHKGQIQVTDNGMTVCFWGGIGITQSAGGYIDIRMKEVTE